MSNDIHGKSNKKSYFFIVLVIALIITGVSVIFVYLINQLLVDGNNGGGS